jgi:PleD family two-component response regulator
VNDLKSFGLTSIRERVKNSSGQFRITGEKGKGTLLIVRIPYKKYNRQMIRVIITDDHPIVRQGIRQILEDDRDQRFGVIDEASDSAGLLEMVLRNEYDVILLDISLPGRSGLDILPDLKKRIARLKNHHAEHVS